MKTKEMKPDFEIPERTAPIEEQVAWILKTAQEDYDCDLITEKMAIEALEEPSWLETPLGIIVDMLVETELGAERTEKWD